MYHVPHVQYIYTSISTTSYVIAVYAIYAMLCGRYAVAAYLVQMTMRRALHTQSIVREIYR